MCWKTFNPTVFDTWKKTSGLFIPNACLNMPISLVVARSNCIKSSKYTDLSAFRQAMSRADATLNSKKVQCTKLAPINLNDHLTICMR